MSLKKILTATAVALSVFIGLGVLVASAGAVSAATLDDQTA
jgi:ABC-type xylose transport system permease subunit